MESVAIKDGNLMLWCPACSMVHSLNINPLKKPVWSIENDLHNLTVHPSIDYKSVRLDLCEVQEAELENLLSQPNGNELAMSDPRFAYRCHFFVRKGFIEYLSDCTHKFVGQKVQIQIE